MTYLNNELYLELTIEEKIKYLNKNNVPKEVRNYLTKILNNLIISVPDESRNYKKDNILNLMYDGLLEGWCFETTESAIVFFNDYDYIERGYIYINDNNPNYYHSWIVFKYENVEYVFDASLNYLCAKENYLRLFNPKVDGIVSAKLVKEELIKQYKNQRLYKSAGFNNFLKNKYPEMYNNYQDIYNNRIYIQSTEDINQPMYRNSSSCDVELDNNKIKKLESIYRFIN